MRRQKPLLHAEIVEHAAPISVAELEALVQTGDLLFTPSTSWLALLIRWFGHTEFSHVMMVDKRTDSDQPTTLLWESAFQADVHCTLANFRKSGVRLPRFDERMLGVFSDNNNAPTVHMAHVRLVFDTPHWPYSVSNALRRYEQAVHERNYELNLVTLMQTVYAPVLGQPVDDARTMFCSELVMRTYQAMGLLAPHAPCSVSLTALSYDSPSVPFVEGVRLEPVVHFYRVLRPNYTTLLCRAAAAAATPVASVASGPPQALLFPSHSRAPATTNNIRTDPLGASSSLSNAATTTVAGITLTTAPTFVFAGNTAAVAASTAHHSSMHIPVNNIDWDRLTSDDSFVIGRPTAIAAPAASSSSSTTATSTNTSYYQHQHHHHHSKALGP